MVDVEKLAKMARIKLVSQEKEKLQKEFETILEYVSILKKVDTRLFSEKGKERESANVTRLDESLDDNSEVEKGKYVKVKRVFE